MELRHSPKHSSTNKQGWGLHLSAVDQPRDQRTLALLERPDDGAQACRALHATETSLLPQSRRLRRSLRPYCTDMETPLKQVSPYSTPIFSITNMFPGFKVYGTR